MEKDDAFWLNVSYIALAGLLYYVFLQAATTVGIETGWMERYDSWWTPADHLVAMVLGILSVFYIKSDRERHEYFLASIGELRKVTWPSVDDTRRMTIIVCVVVGFFAAVLAVFDMAWSALLKQIVA